MKHLYDDWDAVVGRAKGLWAPRWRTASHPAVAKGSSASSLSPSKPGGTEPIKGSVSTADSSGEGNDDEASTVVKLPPIDRQEASGEADEDPDGWGGRGVPTAIPGTGGGSVPPEEAASADGSRNKSRWTRGSWSRVDVRAVQSRLSRIVDDTSARIRNTVVVKVLH